MQDKDREERKKKYFAQMDVKRAEEKKRVCPGFEFLPVDLISLPTLTCVRDARFVCAAGA